MEYINTLFDLFLSLIRLSASFVVIVGLFISYGLIGGVVTLLKRLLDFRKAKDE